MSSDKSAQHSPCPKKAHLNSLSVCSKEQQLKAASGSQSGSPTAPCTGDAVLTATEAGLQQHLAAAAQRAPSHLTPPTETSFEKCTKFGLFPFEQMMSLVSVARCAHEKYNSR